MKFGICILSVVPVRSEPNDRSEMTTQLLFGDLVVVLETCNNNLKIRIVYDNYEGWIDQKQIFEINENEFSRLSKAEINYTKDLVNIVHGKDGFLMPILYGSSLRMTSENEFSIGREHYTYDGHLSGTLRKPQVNSVIEDALLFMNAPYLWGGKTPFGVDCSGFTQSVYKVNGVELLRDAAHQATQGETIGLIDESEPGDLLFFDNGEGKIVHVAILIGKNKVIHASGKVRKDSVDHQGIYNEDLQKYTHNLRLIKRLI